MRRSCQHVAMFFTFTEAHNKCAARQHTSHYQCSKIRPAVSTNVEIQSRFRLIFVLIEIRMRMYRDNLAPAQNMHATCNGRCSTTRQLLLPHSSNLCPVLSIPLLLRHSTKKSQGEEPEKQLHRLSRVRMRNTLDRVLQWCNCILFAISHASVDLTFICYGSSNDQTTEVILDRV